MNYTASTILIAQFAIIAVLTIVTLMILGFAIIRMRRFRQLAKGSDAALALPYELRVLLAGQFGISSLLALTAMAAISLAVVRLSVPWSEKIIAIMMQWMCLASWLNRNYLHPLQATISYAARRSLAVLNFVGSILWLPFFYLDLSLVEFKRCSFQFICRCGLLRFNVVACGHCD